MLSEEEKREYIEHEILDRLYCLEENDFDKSKVDDSYIKAVLNACKEAKNLIEKQQKEIEELKAINQMQKYRIEVIDERELISKDKIREKIEELKKEQKKDIFNHMMIVDNKYNIKYQVLKELLEE